MAAAWELAGVKQIALTTKEGKSVPIGSVEFKPDGNKIGFAISLDHKHFQDYFLSMREFKCLDGAKEILCHVPYPYSSPGFVTVDDLSWLEHNLLFFFKPPSEFGANLWNGAYYVLKQTDEGLTGTPHAIDLNHIAAPPEDANAAPFGPSERHEIPEGSRVFEILTIR